MENLNSYDLTYFMVIGFADNKILINDIIHPEGIAVSHQLPCPDALQRKGNKSSTQLCRLVQYFSKYLGSVYAELNEKQPHLRN